jgi:hypothetical protein
MVERGTLWAQATWGANTKKMGREREGAGAHEHEGNRGETQMTLLAPTQAHLIVQNAIKDCGAL